MYIILICYSTTDFIVAQSLHTRGKDYHLVYVELSDNNNRMGLINDLNTTIQKCINRGDDVVCYLSNSENGKFFTGSEQIDELYFIIGDVNISIPDIEYDLERIISFWNENDVTTLDQDGVTHIMYDKLYIHYYVSPSFYNLSGKDFAFKLLAINNINEINGNTGQAHQMFHFNHGDTDAGFLEFINRNQEGLLEDNISQEFLTY